MNVKLKIAKAIKNVSEFLDKIFPAQIVIIGISLVIGIITGMPEYSEKNMTWIDIILRMMGHTLFLLALLITLTYIGYCWWDVCKRIKNWAENTDADPAHQSIDKPK